MLDSPPPPAHHLSLQGDGRAPTNIDEKLRTSSPTVFGRWPLAAVPAERLHNCKPLQGRKAILDAHGADAGESLAVPGCVAAENARRAMPLASGARRRVMTMESPMQPKRGLREALMWLGRVVGVVKGWSGLGVGGGSPEVETLTSFQRRHRPSQGPQGPPPPPNPASDSTTPREGAGHRMPAPTNHRTCRHLCYEQHLPDAELRTIFWHPRHAHWSSGSRSVLSGTAVPLSPMRAPLDCPDRVVVLWPSDQKSLEKRVYQLRRAAPTPPGPRPEAIEARPQGPRPLVPHTARHTLACPPTPFPIPQSWEREGGSKKHDKGWCMDLLVLWWCPGSVPSGRPTSHPSEINRPAESCRHSQRCHRGSGEDLQEIIPLDGHLQPTSPEGESLSLIGLCHI